VALLLAAIIISSMNFLFYFFRSLPFVHDQAVQPAGGPGASLHSRGPHKRVSVGLGELR
jgi:hypothetical protein